MTNVRPSIARIVVGPLARAGRRSGLRGDRTRCLGLCLLERQGGAQGAPAIWIPIAAIATQITVVTVVTSLVLRWQEGAALGRNRAVR